MVGRRLPAPSCGGFVLALAGLLAVLSGGAAAAGGAATPKPWRVLMLGGSGFRGHYTSERLLKAGHNVTLLSRGNNYWNLLDQLKQKGAVHWKCNRTIDVGFGGALQAKSSGLVNCTPLVNSTTRFDAVVDFSSRTSEELKQALQVLKKRVGVYIFISSHAVYDVSKNITHGETMLYESDAVRPGKEISPLARYELKGKSKYGDQVLECEETLSTQFNSGGFPYVALRIANVMGPKENTIRYWLLHLWLRAHLPLTMPMHLDTSMLETVFSVTFTPDIAQAVERAISRALGETCCPEAVQGQAFNLACEEAPNQRTFYNMVADPIGLPYVETQERNSSTSVVLYPEIVRGPLNTEKALRVLKWSPTSLSKALRSVARFYDRTMLDTKTHKKERDIMFTKSKKMLGDDGPRFVEWIRKYYDEKRKTELYDELDDEDEDDIVLSRPDPERRPARRGRRRQKRGSSSKDDL